MVGKSGGREQVLMEELQFTAEDLAANREGVLSERQRHYLSIDQRKNVILGVLVSTGLFAATVILLYIGITQSNRILQVLGVMLLFIEGAASWTFAMVWMRARYDLESGEVDVTEGEAQHVVRHFARAAAGSVRIGESVEVATNTDAFKAIEPGAMYRLYRTSHSGRFLSIERL